MTDTNDTDHPRRRASDEQVKAQVREYLSVGLGVAADYLNCEPKELVEAIQLAVRTKRRRDQLAKNIGQAFTWTIVAAAIGFIGTVATIVWHHLKAQ